MVKNLRKSTLARVILGTMLLSHIAMAGWGWGGEESGGRGRARRRRSDEYSGDTAEDYDPYYD